MEVHCHPEKALSDAAQALYPEQFDKLMRDIEALAPVVGKSVAHIRAAKKSAPTVALEKSTGTKKEKIVCAFSGKKGAFAEQAIDRYFDGSVKAEAVDSFRELFQAVVDGRADYGMVPIENSLAGSVYQNYDNLTQFEDVSIVGSITLRIQHSLLACKGATLDSVKTVYSHPQALSQCHNYLFEHKDWAQIEAVSTATAAKLVSEKKSPENAAIASAVNAKLYKLEVLKEGIEDDPRNYTRFVIIAPNHLTGDAAEQAFRQQLGEGSSPNMASFMFSTTNEPGALYECLGIFQKAHLNLSRLESRPIAGKPWRYWFYADAALDETIQDKEKYVRKVLNALKEKAEDVRLLGVYNGR